jgi:hypothetical protein
VTTALVLRSAIPLLDLGYCVGELVKVGVERAQDTQERVPTHAPVAVLDLRDVGGFHADRGRDLLLQEPGLVAQGAQRVPERYVVLGGVVAGVDHSDWLYR